MAPLGALQKSFNVAQRDIADKDCARMFYASGLPFNLARSPYFRKYSQSLVNSSLIGYTPPSYDRLRTTLLSQEKAHVNRLLQPIRDSWNKKGVSLLSDGWSDRQRRPLINVMASSAGGAMFVKAIDSSGIVKDGEYVASLFIKAIKEVGEANVVQIVTDNTSNYKHARLSIENKYPHIFWTPCVVHSLNLALKSICTPPDKATQYDQCKWISDLVFQVQNIQTRFASNIIMAIRLREVKTSLEKMVMDANWKIYREDGNSVAEIKAREVKQCIVDDLWWDNIDYLISFTKPIIDILRQADTNSPVLHLVYDMWDTMIESVKKIIFNHEGIDIIVGQSTFFNVIHQILESRWNKSNTPLHCMAHSLVPKYYCHAWLQDGSNGIPRISPHEDREVSMNSRVYAEYGAFSSGSDYFNQPHVINARMFEEPLSWWANHGASAPLLQALAFKLFVQPASSSCCERNWSTYSLIQSVKRDRLATSRAEDLVFVHCNLRFLSRKSKEYKEGPTKYWDICGDLFDIEGHDIMELAQISLDDPEMQTMTFDGDNESQQVVVED
ncbi:uncharacterized protein LOC114263958 [Camellia sinensis]|uniref:uncharacterized protein LOC114263958 n=1 Tax=Camellia sinensis TaxID=4442 RepID=UPI0010359EA6|nr:uncharacterized protein LOC114263958 [Camellia sinensis]